MENRYFKRFRLVSRTDIGYKDEESYWAGRVAAMLTFILLSGVSILALPLKSMAEEPARSAAGRSIAAGAVITKDEIASHKSNPFPDMLTSHSPKGFDNPEDGIEDAYEGFENPDEIRAIKRHPIIPMGPLPRLENDKNGPKVAPAAPILNFSFPGIFNTGSIPADPNIAAGPDHIVAVVNSWIRIYSKNGTVLLNSFLGDWWSKVLPGSYPFDTKVLYDQFSDRWVMVALARNTTTKQSYYLLSTSFTSDATGAWSTWALDATADGPNHTGNWADYPCLGVDDQAIYITSNQFSFSGGFQYAKLRIIGKAQLYNNTGGGIGWWDFWNMKNWEGTSVFTLQPAHTYGTPGVEYLINSRSVGGFDVAVWQLSNPLSAPPKLERSTVWVGGYTAPPNAQQSGGGNGIDTGDARLQCAVWVNGSLYTAHTVSYSSSSGTTSRCRFLQIRTYDKAVLMDTAYGANYLFYYYPSIVVDSNSRLVTVFNRSGASEYASIRFTRAINGSFEGSAPLRTGDSNYVSLDGSRNRWGDYNGAALDPQTGTVWVCSMYASTGNVWGTWIGQLLP